MGIPVQGVYMDDKYGAGKVSRLEHATIDSNQAKGSVRFGIAVVLEGKYVKEANVQHIYGIAIRREYTRAKDFDTQEMLNDKWQDGEVVGVLRDGTISVLISGDVKEGDTATVDTNGMFKVASAGDTGVGTFKSDGRANGVAELQFRIMQPQPQSSTPTPTPTPTPSPTTRSDEDNGSKSTK